MVQVQWQGYVLSLHLSTQLSLESVGCGGGGLGWRCYCLTTHTHHKHNYLNQIFFGVKLCDDNIFPVGHPCKGHVQSTTGDGVCVIGKEFLQTITKVFHHVEAWM